jgi:sugar phosphate isomerase/epimerase
MKISVSTGFAERFNLDVYSAIELVSKTSIRTIELWSLYYGKKKHFDWSDKKVVEDIKNFLKKYEIEVYSIHAPFSSEYEIPAEDKNIVSQLVKDTKDIIETAVVLGAKCVVVHPASKPDTSKNHVPQQIYQKRFDNTKVVLEEIAEFVVKNNLSIKIALENQLPHIMFGYFDELVELIEKINYKELFGICVDTSHAEMSYNTDLPQKLLSITKYIISTHLSDTDGVTDAHLLPLEGKILWNKIVPVLEQIPKDVPLTLEVLTSLKNKTIEETIKEGYRRLNLLFKHW